MKHFRKIWDEEKHEFLMENREMDIKESYALFMEKYPGSEVTLAAYKNERSRIGAIAERYKEICKGIPHRHCPVGSEHTKKDYVLIKVAEPNVWKFKHHYVWEQNTGHEVQPKTETIVFLDGDNRNFDFGNLFLLPRKCMPILNNPYLTSGVVKGHPDTSKVNCLNAMLIKKMHEEGKKAGMTTTSGVFKSKANANQRRLISRWSKERIEQERQKRKERWIALRSDPVRYAEHREKCKKWYEERKRREQG